jgi:deoxyribonuclease V
VRPLPAPARLAARPGARLTPAAARAIQERLRGRVHLRGGPLRPRLVAGADLAYAPGAGRAWAAVVVLRLPELAHVETVTAAGRPGFPYVPGLLSFREGPLLLRAFARLRSRPDALILDGQGLAHPRRFGLACHVGVLLDLPVVGCAKSRLVGEHGEPGPRRGDWTPLRLDGRTVGAVLRTRDGVRPVFVSPGHRIGIARARRLVLAASRLRVPEPIRLAEQAVETLKRAAGASR